MIFSSIAFFTSLATFAFTQVAFMDHQITPFVGMCFFGELLIPGAMCLVALGLNFSRFNPFRTKPCPPSGSIIFSLVGLCLSIATACTVISQHNLLVNN